MKILLTSAAIVGLAIATASPDVALAQGGYRGSDGPTSSAGIIARQTERAQREPGVTSELAPDAKQTATGGPSGGVPGFSGGH